MRDSMFVGLTDVDGVHGLFDDERMGTASRRREGAARPLRATRRTLRRIREPRRNTMRASVLAAPVTAKNA